MAKILNFTIDKFVFIGYNNSGDKLRLIVWKLYASVKSSESYCEWNR